MPRKLRQLRADLRRAGWTIDRQKGSHEQWKHPCLPGDLVTLQGADGDNAQHYQERDVKGAVERAQNAP